MTRKAHPHTYVAPVPPIVCYCLASIIMTVVNKVRGQRLLSCCILTNIQFVVSGTQFNMNFFLLCIQSTVCVSCVYTVKKLGIISFRTFDMKDAKAWFPISFLLVSVIYTGSKSLVRFSQRCRVVSSALRNSIAIPQHPCVHYLQELDHYPHCTLSSVPR